jgi:hypothetical protein
MLRVITLGYPQITQIDADDEFGMATERQVPPRTANEFLPYPSALICG